MKVTRESVQFCFKLISGSCYRSEKRNSATALTLKAYAKKKKKSHKILLTHQFPVHRFPSPPVGNTGSLIERPSEQRLEDSKSHHISNGTELNHLPKSRRHYSARRRARREPEGCCSIFVFSKTKPLLMPVTPFMLNINSH